ncbi:MAG: hypothetical protein JST17_11910 [Bacteroidetes bacterium]|nr:hypothetical protein [Bacteroidota bacterium]
MYLPSAVVFESADVLAEGTLNTSPSPSLKRWTEMAASPVVLLRKPLLWLATKTRPA